MYDFCRYKVTKAAYSYYTHAHGRELAFSSVFIVNAAGLFPLALKAD